MSSKSERYSAISKSLKKAKATSIKNTARSKKLTKPLQAKFEKRKSENAELKSNLEDARQQWERLMVTKAQLLKQERKLLRSMNAMRLKLADDESSDSGSDSDSDSDEEHRQARTSDSSSDSGSDSDEEQRRPRSPSPARVEESLCAEPEVAPVRRAAAHTQTRHRHSLRQSPSIFKTPSELRSREPMYSKHDQEVAQRTLSRWNRPVPPTRPAIPNEDAPVRSARSRPTWSNGGYPQQFPSKW